MIQQDDAYSRTTELVSSFLGVASVDYPLLLLFSLLNYVHCRLPPWTLGFGGGSLACGVRRPVQMVLRRTSRILGGPLLGRSHGIAWRDAHLRVLLSSREFSGRAPSVWPPCRHCPAGDLYSFQNDGQQSSLSYSSCTLSSLRRGEFLSHTYNLVFSSDSDFSGFVVVFR